MQYNTEKIRQFLSDTEVPKAICREYLSILININMIYQLLDPVDLEEALSHSQLSLESLLARHYAQKLRLEVQYPDLELAGNLHILESRNA